MERDWLEENIKIAEDYIKEPRNAIRFATTIYTIRTEDSFHVWSEWHNRVEWVQDSMGFNLFIGDINGRPISIEGFWAVINGQRVLFYDGSSTLIDYDMIEAWLDRVCNPIALDGLQARTNALNFSSVVQEIQRRTGISIRPNTSYCSKCNRDALYPPLCLRCVNERVKNQIYFSENLS